MLVGLSDEQLRDAVDVAYRASDEPQRLDVRVRYAAAPDLPRPPWAIQTIAEAIAAGAACGAELDPTRAACVVVDGPTGLGPASAASPAERAAAYAWSLEVSGLATKWIPVMVEHLVAAGLPHATELVSIVGALPLDRSPRSVRSPETVAALRAPLARAGATAAPGFAIERRAVARGFAIKARLRTEVTSAIARAFAEAISAWQGAVLTYPNLALAGRGFMDPQLVTGRTRAELHARATLFDHAPAPACDALINVMARFHAQIAPIELLEIGAP